MSRNNKNIIMAVYIGTPKPWSIGATFYVGYF